MANDQPVFLCVHLAAIEVVGNLTTNENSDTRSHHFVIVSVDGKAVAKSDKKLGILSSPQWKWQEDNRFWLSPSSTIKIMIYRKSRNKFTKRLIGQHTSKKAIELVENDTTIDLKDKTGATIASKIKIKLSLVSDLPDETFMKSVHAHISRLDDAVARCYSMISLP